MFALEFFASAEDSKLHTVIITLSFFKLSLHRFVSHMRKRLTIDRQNIVSCKTVHICKHACVSAHTHAIRLNVNIYAKAGRKNVYAYRWEKPMADRWAER
jgi:hypothetical protein